MIYAVRSCLFVVGYCEMVIAVLQVVVFFVFFWRNL